jgi:hypothetical protein
MVEKYVFSDTYSLFGPPTEGSTDLIFVQLGWYIYGLALDRHKIDMLLHHIVTITLLLYSKYTLLENFGLAVCLVHDISDPFLHVAKLFNYNGKYPVIRDIIFGMFATIFLTTRLCIFPYLAYRYAQFSGFTIGFFGICALQVLHIRWSWLISKIIYKVIRGQDVKDDD